jgi:invasion protein IalB
MELTPYNRMKNLNKRAIFGLAAAVLIVGTGGAFAQQAPTAHPSVQKPAAGAPPAPGGPAPAADEPQRTTATYGDWVVQCVTTTNPPSEAVCDMAQVTQLQGKNVPFSRIAVAHPDKSQPINLTVQVPVNASFTTQVNIQAGDDDPGIIAPFTACTPNGCFAEFALRDDMLKKLRAATSAGKVSFADAGGHAVTVPISFNGFGAAFDALVKK